MAVKRFGRVRQLPSGNYQASFAAPSGGRVTAPVTFTSAEDAEVWLATQRADLVRKLLSDILCDHLRGVRRHSR